MKQYNFELATDEEVFQYVGINPQKLTYVRRESRKAKQANKRKKTRQMLRNQ